MNKHIKELKDIIAADPLDAFISVVFFITVVVVAAIFLEN